jgi:tetratricopeptide (TPR) repeat protein
MKKTTAKEWIEKGDTLFDSQKYEKAINCYGKALELEPDNDDTWTRKGYALAFGGRYEEAIKCYNKAIDLNPMNVVAWTNRDYALAFLERYEEANEYYDKAIKANQENDLALESKGAILAFWGRYEEAIECYDKAIELNPINVFFKGLVLASLRHYEKAIECYNKAIKLYPTSCQIWLSKGYALNSWGCEKAIECHEKAIECYEKAIECYNKTIELNPKEDAAWEAKCCTLVSLGRYDETTTCFDEFIEENPTSEWANLYNQVCEEGKRKDMPYKKLFVISRFILNMLHVKDEAERGVAHYTTPNMLNVLILEEVASAFRLHLINLSNDSSEGRTLMDYLYQKKSSPIKDNGIIALSASFTFNQDCLNQFRLYGKGNDGNQEGSGVSIIMKGTFFEKAIKAPSSMMAKQSTPSENASIRKTMLILPKDSYQDQKEALFRCMYVDPETQQVIALGQKEEYTFYRDNLNEKKKSTKEEVGKEIEKYRKDMDERLEKVQKAMDEILKIIRENDLDFDTVADLLADLRCLTKHVAFKEEQECRIVKVINYMTNNKVKHRDDYHQLYMDYLPLATDRTHKVHYIKKVCFGPHFKYREVYAAELRRLGIESSQSTHPLA